MYSQQDFESVKEQLKTAIVEGKVTCHRCSHPLSGADIKQIDLFNQRIIYKCPDMNCGNHDRNGYRSFRALEITVPSMLAPTDLSDVVAPEPPTPETVEWDEGDDEITVDDINDPDSEE